jgi:hypothetical protein
VHASSAYGSAFEDGTRDAWLHSSELLPCYSMPLGLLYNRVRVQMFITKMIHSIGKVFLDTVAFPPTRVLLGVLENEPYLARKFLIVAPACYPISCCPRKRALGVTTSSDGGASTSTAVAVGQRTGAHHYPTVRLGLAVCHVWHSVRCFALFRSLRPPFSFEVYLYI